MGWDPGAHTRSAGCNVQARWRKHLEDRTRKMARNSTTVLFTAAMVMVASGAAAQTQMSCSQHSKVVGQFATSYQEVPVAGGLTEDGRLIEVLSSGDGKTWTIIISKSNGETCVMMAGEGWKKLNITDDKQEPNA